MLSDIKSILLRLNDISISNRILKNAREETALQLSWNVFETPKQRALGQIIFEHALKAELVGPGGFTECVRFTLVSLKQQLCGYIPFTHSDDTRVLECVSIKPNIFEVEKFLDNTLKSQSKIAVLEALKLAGLSGKILLKRSENKEYSVELVQGYSFDLPCSTVKTRLELFKPKLLVIDGYVESVSEINSLLLAAAETKIPLIVFARGFADDVISTMSVNTLKETLTAIPVIVKFDLEGMNTLNDVCVVSGANLVSSTMGNLISSVKFDSLKSIQSATITKSSIVIVENSTAIQVAGQVLMLQKKLETSIEDTHKLIELRLKSLMPNTVCIRIPETFGIVSETQAIDTALRSVKSMITSGMTIDCVPTATIAAAKFYSKKCVDVLNNVGCIIAS